MGQKLWGIKSGNEDKPIWLTDTEKENTFATNGGWVLRHPSGIEETLVSIANLKTKLGAASITEVKFGTGTYTEGTTKTVRVTYNEKVTVTGNPTLVVTGATAGAITATYASTTGQGNVLVFNFTVPADPDTLSIGAQSVSLAGGTIVETDVTPTVNADLAISATIASAAGTKTVVAA
jgi:hypothetical protein